jgi:plasmid stabilization system protein ParE
MPLRLRIAAAAARDIDRIAYYSRRRWGAAVAVRYVTGLWQAIGRIRRIPSIGSNYGEILEAFGAIAFDPTPSTMSFSRTA